MPKVSGAAGEVNLSNDTIKLLNIMDKLAQDRKDQYISSELFVLAAIEDSGQLGDLMKKAGYDKQGAVDFFTKLEELEKEYGIDKRDAVNDFISSHPTARARRDRVEKL